ncbi:hypothetical protein C7434_3778 [Pantoea sp. PNA 14-12]|uniref:hypothetical protein n=1 Tax=Pantoea TaxID=53335 RepID=UPI0004954582|nr:hypothetical protein [Pantoea]MCS3401392.1 hypothetical protein [Pantoea sp. B566]PVY84033.1 hypothetical protein C7427_105247 [Pantoea ananatis]TDS68033.1 hypothetical protein C7434_3778 [Pantoea sp. PNA 14-12]
MLGDNEKVTNVVTGEALLSLIKENAVVSNESLASRLQFFLRTEKDAQKRRAILNALQAISVLSEHPESCANLKKSVAHIFPPSGSIH